MKNIVYFHGLSSSGNSRTGLQLRQLFPNANVITPDIPVYPSEALLKLRKLLAELDPKDTVVVGTSMGGMYAQQMHGFKRILVNPAFHVSNHLKEALGKKLPFHSPREDGAMSFQVTEELINDFLEMEARQFDNTGGEVIALFGTKDTTVNCKEEYLKYYSDFRDFEGEHRLSPENVENVVAPLIKEKFKHLTLATLEDSAKLLDKAALICVTKHQGQRDKMGCAYFQHPMRVAMRCATDDEKIVALLHDTIEDTDVTPEYLLSDGFPQYIVDAVLSVTKKDGESYEDFVARAKENPIGRQVKIHDLEDNLDVMRLDEVSPGMAARFTKYLKAIRTLKE